MQAARPRGGVLARAFRAGQGALAQHGREQRQAGELGGAEDGGGHAPGRRGRVQQREVLGQVRGRQQAHEPVGVARQPGEPVPARHRACHEAAQGPGQRVGQPQGVGEHEGAVPGQRHVQGGGAAGRARGRLPGRGELGQGRHGAHPARGAVQHAGAASGQGGGREQQRDHPRKHPSQGAPGLGAGDVFRGHRGRDGQGAGVDGVVGLACACVQPGPGPVRAVVGLVMHGRVRVAGLQLAAVQPQALREGLVGHPAQRGARQAVPGIGAAHVAVHAAEPALREAAVHALAVGEIRIVVAPGRVGHARLVQRHRMPDMGEALAGESGRVGDLQPAQHADADGFDGVPDTHEMHQGHAAQGEVLDHVAREVLAIARARRVAALRRREVGPHQALQQGQAFRMDEPVHVDHAGHGARGERPPGKAQQVDAIPGLVVAGEEFVGARDVVEHAAAERQAREPVAGLPQPGSDVGRRKQVGGADARVVVHELPGAGARLGRALVQHAQQLHDVGVLLVAQDVARAVEEQHEVAARRGGPAGIGFGALAQDVGARGRASAAGALPARRLDGVVHGPLPLLFPAGWDHSGEGGRCSARGRAPQVTWVGS